MAKRIVDQVRDYALDQAYHDDVARVDWETVHYDLSDLEITGILGPVRTAKAAKVAITRYVRSFDKYRDQ